MKVVRSLGSIFIAILLLTSACGVGVLLGSVASRGDGMFAGGPAVAVVRVEGTIMSGEPGGIFASGGAYSGTIVRYLERAGQNTSVRAVVLRVDSPGGGITPSDEIRNQVVKLKKESKKPVIVSMGSTAASGGYYVSAPADTIFANETTITGSIGVISIVPNLKGLLEKVGVTADVLTSGPHKDTGSGLVPLEDDDRQILQSVVNDAYERFVDVVSEGRGLDRESVRKLSDGRIYTGKQAKELKLIDEYGDLPEAIALAARMGGIIGKPRIIEFGDKGSVFGLGASLLSRVAPATFSDVLSGSPNFSINYLYSGAVSSSIIWGRQ
ncbi:MAG: signal peptide peptidase SppA [Dehalococcoidia bacterium]|nr:signal peptide peptidase SppA [Dehalococcoidia bacterium]